MTSRRAQRRRELDRRAPTSLGGLPLDVEERVARGLAAVLERPEVAALPGWGATAHRHAQRVAVAPERRRGIVLGAGRPLGCYELAAAYVATHHDQGPLLRHGFVVEELDGGAVPLPHGWALVDDTTVYDPSPGDFFDAGSWQEVLQPVVVCEHPAAEVAARVAAGEGSGPWPACDERYALALDALQDAFDAAHGALVDWTGNMLERDPVFRARFQEAARRGRMVVLHVMLDLARADLWRGHEPGSSPWPHRLRVPRVAGIH